MGTVQVRHGCADGSRRHTDETATRGARMYCKTITMAGITIAAGLTALIGASAAHAATPAGQTVAYVRGGVIYSSNGTDEVRLTEDEVNARPRFSPDGAKLA